MQNQQYINRNMSKEQTAEQLNEQNNEQQNAQNIQDAIKEAGIELNASNVSDEDNVQEESREQLQAQIAELKEDNLRLLAEMQNIRTRHEKDLKGTREYAISNFANDMLTILENLNRAKDAIPQDESDEKYVKMVEGLELVSVEVRKIMEKYGIQRLAPQAGEKFDYKLHQAMVQIPTTEFEDGVIYQLIQAGYTMKDRVLRPAMVSVAKKIEPVND